MRNTLSGPLPRDEPKLRLLFSRAAALKLSYLAALVLAFYRFGPTPLSIGIPTAVFLVLMTDGVVRPGSPLFCPVVTRGPREQIRVALSFDDGPDPQVTPAVLDALAAHGG